MNTNTEILNSNVNSVYHTQQSTEIEKSVLLQIGNYLLKKRLISEHENRKYQDLVSREI